ncbi:hypothetical protein PHMEG_0004708 [Phytophthora megakarya]|uniref:DDE Tnp4 domain-containing protein n=1 Tax=Phytophthora megakarya TaxID=4795 RepID=A0A225WV83_9STRA|nr:hypothetical protein PHMEG_0004708 [Phytophthora megakarya]
MASTAAQVLNRLTTQWDEETANLSSSHENFCDVARHVEDESSDSEVPILAQFVASGGDDTLKGMPNFSCPELDALWALVDRLFPGKDVLFITLTKLKHFDTWHKHAIEFNMGVSTLEKIHRQMLMKEDDSVPELGGEPSQFPQAWGVLVYKCFQEEGRVLRTIQPRKQPRGGTLDQEDIARNKAISADRLLVENCFGRMWLLCKATYANFKWNENRFDSVARLSTALTNYHVGLMPLSACDNEHYDMVLSKYHAMGERIRTQRSRAQRHYRMRLQVRSRPASHSLQLSVKPSLNIKNHCFLDRHLPAFQANFKLS